MIKRLLFLTSVALLTVVASFGQQNTFSPYSRFGIGDISNKGFGRSQALGGIGIGLRDGKHINYQNPASYTSQDTLSFIFDIGISSNATLFETETREHTMVSAFPSHLALGFPVTDWWKASAGLVPFSKVGYKIEDSRSVDRIGLVDYLYEGSGGINRAYIGNAFRLHDNVSVGIDISYLFGSLTRSSSIDFPFDEHAYKTKSENRVVVRDFHFKYGVQYSNRINEDYSFTAGVVFENSTPLDAREDRFVINEVTVPEGVSRDTILNHSGEKNHIDLPLGWGAGFSVTRGENLVVGADYKARNWSDAEFMGHQDSLANSGMLNVGVQYTHDPDDYESLLKRTSYRLGFHYENTYLRLNEHQLTDYGITLGFGIPYRDRDTSFNFAINLGQRGTIEDNLVKENYVVFSFSTSLYDFWFHQRRYE